MLNFLGLQGASGPLPGSVLDEIAEASYENESIQAKYLDFFNHHLLTIFHQNFGESINIIYGLNLIIQMTILGIF